MTDTTRELVYTGPYPEVITQTGYLFKQGQPTKVPADIAQRLVGAEFEEARKKASPKGEKPEED